MKILVTGGAGFIGSALTNRLLALGHEVQILDDFSRAGTPRNRHLWGSVCDPVVVTSVMKDKDAIIHLAAINGTANFYKYPARVLDVAIRGTMNVIDALTENQTLILASSSEVYQDAAVIPTPEEVQLVVPDLHNPRYSYGGGKIAAELLAFHVASTRAKRVCIVRPHNIYGPAMGWDHVIPQFIDRLRAGGPLEIQGTGKETRAFCCIEDAVEGIAAVLNHGRNLGVYNVGDDRETSIEYLARTIGRMLGREQLDIRGGALVKGSPKRRCPDITKLRALGYSPKVPLETGLAKTIAWYAQNRRTTCAK